MSTFAGQHRYPGYIWLAKLGQHWIAREAVPPPLLRAHDEALDVLDVSPNDRTAAVAWLNALDRIVETSGHRILDRPMLGAALQADKLRSAGELRRLDHMLSIQRSRP
jgi:hypothetical protein